MLVKLKEIREKSDLTQIEMSEKLGVTKGYYSMIENGKRGLSYKMASKIASIFGLKPDDIFLNTKFTKSKQE